MGLALVPWILGLALVRWRSRQPWRDTARSARTGCEPAGRRQWHGMAEGKGKR